MTEKAYKKIRNIYSNFVYEILDSANNRRERIIDSGKRLGFWDGESMVFEYEEETNVLAEYCLYEYRENGKRIIDKFHENYKENILEKTEILNGMRENHFSLFEIIDISKKNSILKLKDQIKNEIHQLMDLNLSLTARKRMIISTRLVPVYDINMTSGLTFQFHEEKRLKILTELSNRTTGKFETIFKLSKKYGIQVESIDT